MLLIATGMHRSGTSAVTGLLSSAGAQLGTPSTLMPAHESNSRGHYEQIPIVAINDEILGALGGHWLHPGPVTEDELRGLASSALGARASAALTECGWNPKDLGALFVVKDPRFCITLPFWRELLGDQFEVLVVYRHPDEVAASLQARDGVDDGYGVGLWADYNLRILRNCVGLKVLGVHFGSAIGEPEQLVGQLQQRFELHSDVDDSAISSSLRSHVQSEPVPEDLRPIWTALEQLDGQKAAAPSLDIDRDKPVGTAGSVLRAIANEQARTQKLQMERDLAAQATIEALQNGIGELELRIEALSEEADELRHEIGELIQEKHQSEEHLRAYTYSKAASPTRLFWRLKNRVTGQVPPEQRFTHTRSAFERSVVESIALPDTPTKPVSARTSDIPLVSIVVPVHGQLALTSACLQSIVNAPDLTPYEIIVVDDASADETPQWLASCENVRIVTMDENVGYLRATNAGAAVASGSYLCLLNNDVLVTGRWLRSLLKPFKDRDDTGAVGARLVYPDGSLQEAGGIIFSDGSGWNYGRGEDPSDPRFLSVRTVDFSSAACLMVRRDLWDQLDGYDERYCPAYYEDVDLAFRLRERGFQVRYQPEATIVHFEGQSHGTDESVGLKAYQTHNRAIFAERWSAELQTHQTPGSSPDAAAWNLSGPHVLIVDHQVPTPDADAGSLRMKLMLESLLELGCRVTFVPANGHEHARYGKALRQMGVGLRVPERSTQAPIDVAPDGVDIVILSRPDVATESLAAVKQRFPDAKVVYDMVDFHTVRLRRQAELSGDPAHLEAAESYQQIERALFENADLVIAVTDAEADAVRDMIPDAAVHRLGTIHPRHRGAAGYSARTGALFVGSWNHPPNRDAIEWIIDEIAPALALHSPAITIHIVGSDIPKDTLAVSNNVEVHGWLPSLDAMSNGVRVAIAPLRFGAGIKGKVADALARGLPVVTTPVGAEGFDHVRSALSIVKTTDEFVSAIAELHGDPDRWATTSALGSDLVDELLGPRTARAAIAAILYEATSP